MFKFEVLKITGDYPEACGFCVLNNQLESSIFKIPLPSGYRMTFCEMHIKELYDGIGNILNNDEK